jgi:hypothetical protein
MLKYLECAIMVRDVIASLLELKNLKLRIPESKLFQFIDEIFRSKLGGWMRSSRLQKLRYL